ncbi:hypothetical protein ABPG74_012178 [Tetrahymena malaccensis]
MKKSNISQSQSSSSRIFDSQLGEEMNDAMENVQVAIRIRGLNQREQDSLQTICVLKDDLIKGRLTIGHTNNAIVQDLKEFYYDQVFGPNDSQQALFENVGKQMALACLSGYNVCIFAYGQTGAGKTFTMMGNEEDKGLIQRILNFIFAKMKSRKQEFVIQSQYYEIYMEEIIDLYQPQKNKNVRVIEDFNGVRVENLSTVQITNHQQAVELIQKGQKNRHIGATRMNAESSRSHSIFSMTINLKDKDPSSGVVRERSSKLHFVDLAGSERQKQTQATGQRLKEAAQINQSLSTLGIVIHALAEGQRKICYRNSKLTHILKDSLGGNSKTLMIANVSPSQDSYGETLSTLKFAERAKYIKNRALINEKPSENLENLQKEIQSLKEELQLAIKNNKLQQELITSYNIKKNEISNSPLISQEAQASPSLTEEEKQMLIKSVDEFQNWLREFLKESGFLDFIQELRQRMGININDMMCVESARDVDSQQWSSLFQVPVENLKEYIKTIMEFNKYTGMITGQYDIDLKNKNEQLNSQLHQIKEELIKKDLQMVDCRNSIINEMKAQSQIGSDQKDQTIAELKSMLDQLQVENSQHINYINQMEEEMQRKDESISNLHQKITNLLSEIQKIKKKNSSVDLEQKEINENLLKINEQNEVKLKQLQNEIDNLQMQNVSLQEELESEQHKYFMQKEEYESKQEKTSTLHQTISYQLKLIEDLQKQIAEENKQINLIYKHFSIEKEISGVPPYSNLWKYIQNTVTDLGCEKDQKNSLIEEIQGMCLHESSLLRAKSEQILKQNQESQQKREEAKIQQSNLIQIPDSQMEQQDLKKMPIDNMFENIHINNNQVKINVQTVLNKEYLQEYIQIQSQQLITWNIIGKQVSDQTVKENNTNFIASPHISKQEELNKNRYNKYNQKEMTKTKSQSEIRYGSNQKQFQQSHANPQLKQQKEFNLGEKQKIDAIQQLIQDNKVLCEGLILKLDEADKLKQEVKNAKEEIFKIKQEYEINIENYQEKFQQNQNQLNQQLSQIISFDIIKQNLEEEISNLKEENEYIKQVLADNTQRLEELTKEKDQIEDSSFFYELKSKQFQDRLLSIQAENDEQKQKINEQCIALNSNKKQIQELQKELSNTQSRLIESNQKIIYLQSSQQSNKHNCNCQNVRSFSNQSIKQNLNQKFQTVSPAHKNVNDKNHSNSEGNSENNWERESSPMYAKKINMDYSNQQSDKNQSNNLNVIKQGNASESSEFYSAYSSFSKIEAFSQKASQPVSYQNSCNQEINLQKNNQQINNLNEKESVQKQLNFNFSNENHLINQNQSAQFSFFNNIKQDQQQESKSLLEQQSNCQKSKQILENSANEKQTILQPNQISQIIQNSEKKQIKQQMHANQQLINNQLNSLNPIQLIKQFEQQQKLSSTQSLSNNNISSNQSLSDNLNTKKKRSFLQLLDQIEEDESENKHCPIELMQTMYNKEENKSAGNKLNANQGDQSENEEEDDDDDQDDIEIIQKMFNLKDNVYKKRFNELEKQKYS